MKNRINIIIVATIIAIFGVIVMPTLYGVLQQPTSHIFTGVRDFAPADNFVYYSYLQQVEEGSVLLENLYTTETSKPIFNFFWYTMGLIASFTGVSYVALFLLARVFFAIIFFVTLYKVISYFSKSKESIIWQYLLMLTFGGLGPFLLFFLPRPDVMQLLDITAIEHNIVLLLASSPHLILSTLLVIGMLFFAYRSIEEKSTRYGVMCGIIGLLLFQFHPYYVPLIYGITLLYFGTIQIREKYFDRKLFLRTIVPILSISGISIIYHLYLFFNDEIFFMRSLSNVDQFDSPIAFLASFSIFLPFAMYGVYRIYKDKDFTNKHIFLVIWFIFQGILIISPISFQRKFLEAWFFPMVCLAWYGGEYVLMKYKQKYGYSIVTIVTVTIVYIVLTFSTYFNVARTFIFYQNMNEIRKAGLIYITDNRNDALAWVKDNLEASDVVLSHASNSMVIPAYTGRRVYIGHWSETIFFTEEKAPNVKIFFDERTQDIWRKQFLATNGITYIWYGEKEKKTTFNPEETLYMEVAYENDEVIIFKVSINYL